MRNPIRFKAKKIVNKTEEARENALNILKKKKETFMNIVKREINVLSSKNDNKPIYEQKTFDKVKNLLETEKKKETKRYKKKNELYFEWDEKEDTTLLLEKNEQSNMIERYNFQRNNLQKNNNSVIFNDINTHNKLFDDNLLRYSISLDDEKSDVTIKPLDSLLPRDWRIFREIHNISIKIPTDIPDILPYRNWEEFDVPDNLYYVIKDLNHSKPTPVQMQFSPIISQGYDCVGISATGSGKTLAYLIPIVSYILQKCKFDTKTINLGPKALILVPTRELAQQIEKEGNRLGSIADLNIISIVGGRSIEEQSLKMSKNVDILIATPGRIIDCLERAFLVLGQCKFFVLDEADRMIGDGFYDLIRSIHQQISNENQNIMTSATMNQDLAKLANEFLKKPVWLNVVNQSKDRMIIKQKFIQINENEKDHTMLSLLSKSEFPIIIFTNLKRACDLIYKKLKAAKYNVSYIHGGKNQDAREAAIDDFKKRKVDILVATDIAGRGLDINGIKLVINYDMPKSIETYTHRIGRTGRAGNIGASISFFTPVDSHLIPKLKQFLVDSNQQIPSFLDEEKHIFF